jgi:prefoldin subunit 4
MELELADEEDTVPWILLRLAKTIRSTCWTTHRYKIGDAFFHVPLPQAQEMLGLSTALLEEEIEELEDKLGTIRGEMTELKVDLYARFGKTINLETWHESMVLFKLRI